MGRARLESFGHNSLMERCRISGDHTWHRGVEMEHCVVCGLLRPLDSCKHSWLGDAEGVRCRRCGLPLRATLLTRDERMALNVERRPLPAAERRVIAEGGTHRRAWKAIRQNGFSQCFWCRSPFTSERPPTEDHVLPISKGGNRGDGVVFTCQSCNSARGDTDFAEYQRAVEVERELATVERREFRRPKYRKIGDRWSLTAMTRREVIAARAAAQECELSE